MTVVTKDSIIAGCDMQVVLWMNKNYEVQEVRYKPKKKCAFPNLWNVVWDKGKSSRSYGKVLE